MLQYEDAVLPRFFSHDVAQLQNSSVQLGLGFQARFHIPVYCRYADYLQSMGLRNCCNKNVSALNICWCEKCHWLYYEEHVDITEALLQMVSDVLKFSLWKILEKKSTVNQLPLLQHFFRMICLPVFSYLFIYLINYWMLFFLVSQRVDTLEKE